MNVEGVGAAGPGREILVVGARLREGATVVARVLEAAAGEDGLGLLSLAGARARAQLPAALRAGEQLRLLVAGVVDDKLVLRILQAETDGSVREVPARVVAQMATQGDGAMLHAASALAGGVVALPGGVVLAVDPEEAAGEESEQPAHALRLVIHSAALGALELRVALLSGRVGVGVTTEPGIPFELAAEEQADLAARIEAVTGLAAAVGVAVRRGPAPERPQPPPLGEMTLYA